MSRENSHRAVVIGCSTGGLAALEVVLGGLHGRLAACVIVVCHSGAEDSDLLCELLGRYCRLPVREAAERALATAGAVHVAPPGYHLLIERDERFALSVDPKICYVRPAADVSFASAADVWRRQLIGVILTGANDDGAEGLKRIRQRGGYALVQSPDEARAPEMPRAALGIAGADEVLSLAAIASRINQLCLRHVDA